MSQGIFASLYQRAEPFALIDTRERRQQVNGHWFGSTNLPLSLLAQKIRWMLPDRAFPIYLLDWQDKASDVAASLLSRLGYHNVTRCKTSAPDAFGYGFVKGEFVWSKAFGEVVAHTSGLLEVTPADYLAKHKQANLFDVRPTAEYTQFTIPGSRSLPNSLLLANMDALQQEGEMALLHCAGRTRSIIGACTLKAAGYRGQFAIFKGGTQAWQLEGYEREFNATRLFGGQTDSVTPAREFLDKWRIHYRVLDNTDVDSYLASNTAALRFDVSDDAATGQLSEHNSIKISGTNLIQQTDRSIACYHVPVILFDHGSGSRAAFAAYWLAAMGFTVSVVFLKDELATVKPGDHNHLHPSDKVLSVDQLLKISSSTVRIIDLRPSKEYGKGYLRGSQWVNISELLGQDSPGTDAVVVIGGDGAHANDMAELLESQGWQVDAIYGWNTHSIDQAHLETTTLASPIDECALFAGRHHGNLQDSRDYLAWEEALPEQIDQPIHQLWHQLLGRSAANP